MFHITKKIIQMKKRKPLKYHNNQDVRMDTYVKLTCAYSTYTLLSTRTMRGSTRRYILSA
jgi:hypothetical protein